MFDEKTRILLAEDDEVMSLAVRRQLEALGIWRITTAMNGEEAWREIKLSLAEENPYHLVISDWNMPTFDGLWLLQKIRGVAETHSIPVLFLTGANDVFRVREAISHGVNAYIVKPFPPETLEQKLLAILVKFKKCA